MISISCRLSEDLRVRVLVKTTISVAHHVSATEDYKKGIEKERDLGVGLDSGFACWDWREFGEAFFHLLFGYEVGFLKYLLGFLA